MSSRTSGDRPDPASTVSPEGKQPSASAKTSATASAAAPGTKNSPPLLTYQRVIVYEVKGKKRRKKKKYSAGLKSLQRLADGFTDSSARLTRSVSSGARRYRKASNKSARRKRDGSITDFLDNVSKGAGRTLRVASLAPYDFSRRINTKPYTRFVRATVGFALSPFFR